MEYVNDDQVYRNSHDSLTSQGRYIPMFAAAIYDQNAQLIEAGMSPVNLSSVMIGE